MFMNNAEVKTHILCIYIVYIVVDKSLINLI